MSVSRKLGVWILPEKQPADIVGRAQNQEIPPQGLDEPPCAFLQPGAMQEPGCGFSCTVEREKFECTPHCRELSSVYLFRNT